MTLLYQDKNFLFLLADSYSRIVGGDLIPPGISNSDAATWIYEFAPFVVLAHNTEADPLFIYGNKAAQRRFGYDWDELTTLRSRLSAEAQNRDERSRFLGRVQQFGFESNYSGVRVTKSGQRFRIEDATLWQLSDIQGKLHGQAVIIPRTRDL